MAIRPVVTPNLPSVPRASSRVETARAAQAAFFQAALSAEPARATAAPAPASTTEPVRPAPPVGRAAPAPTDADGQPARTLRPGSLLDIKV